VGGEVDEVVDAELFEGADEVAGGALGAGGVGVGFEFVFAREEVAAEGEKAADGLEEDGEEDEASGDRDMLSSDAEGGEAPSLSVARPRRKKMRPVWRMEAAIILTMCFSLK